MKKASKTSIIVVSWNHKRFLSDCFRAVEESGLDRERTRLMIVDNNSSDGTADFIRRELLTKDGKTTKDGFPVVFFDNKENLGFSGGNNLAMRKAVEDGDDYVYLLNPDTEATPGFIEEAIAVAESEGSIGVVQSQLRLHPKNELINTFGNEIHYLGFGYAGGESIKIDSGLAQKKLKVRDIAYASGAGMLIKTSLLEKIGYLDEEFFAYHEDLEFSWRARLAGFRVMLAPKSIIYHKYEFSRSIKKYYWMERNRLLVTLRCYKIATLILIFPAWLAMELGLWVFAFKSGWWKEKFRAYGYFLLPGTWIKIVRNRKMIRELRVISDREATSLFTGKILFQQMRPFLLTRIANPVFSLYWKIVHLLMIW